MKTQFPILRMLIILTLSALACSFPPGAVEATPTLWVITPAVALPTEPPFNSPTPRPTSASAGDSYIDQVVSFTPGNPVNPSLGNVRSVFGPPDFDSSDLTGFLDLGIGGIVEVQFVDNKAVDGPGEDIEIFGDPDNDEQWIVEASADCTSYKSFGQVDECVRLDLATLGLASARCIRITDKGHAASGAVSPGTELDAIQALNNSAP